MPQKVQQNTSFSKTAAKALDLLYLFVDCETLTLSDIVRRTKLSQTIAFRLLYTLVDRGYLEQDRASKAYTLGKKVIILGYKAIHSQSIRTLAQPLLHQLTAGTGLDSLLNICVGQMSLCLDKIAGGSELETAMKIGSSYPLHKGASSLVLLAFLPKFDRGAYLDGLQATPAEVNAIERDLAQIQERGYGYSVGQLSTGLFSVAFPVFGLDGNIISSISVSGPAYNITDKLRREYVEKVREAAAQLGRLMGYQEKGPAGENGGS